MDISTIILSVYTGLLTIVGGFLLRIIWGEIQRNRNDIQSNKDKVDVEDKDMVKEMHELRTELTKVSTQLKQIFHFMQESKEKDRRQDQRLDDLEKNNN